MPLLEEKFDDLAAFALFHIRKGRLDAEESAVDIYGHHLLPLLKGNFLNGMLADNAGHIGQGINSAVNFPDFSENLVHGLLVGDVHHPAMGLIALAAQKLSAFHNAGVHIQQGNFGARLAVTLRYAEANALLRAGNDAGKSG